MSHHSTAHIVFTTFGSHGDVHPYLAVGTKLRDRGHRVTIATSAVHAGEILSADLGFHPVRPDLSINKPYFVDAYHGVERVVCAVASAVRESYADILTVAQQADVLVTHPLTFAAVLVAEKLNLPWISSKLMPSSFASAYDPDVDPNGPALVTAAARLGISPSDLIRGMSLKWVRPVVEFHHELGLGQCKHPFFEGSASPELSLILFSRYFADRQPDWPANALVSGFAFYDQGGQPATLSPELRRFLAEGDAPAVFTLGSTAVGAAGDFYLRSLTVVQRLGIRAIFLTGDHNQEIPERLSEDTINVAYAPHAALFPHASVVVHSGGIGTTAQAMRAGRPTLVVPFAFDQFDNANRVRRLGLGEVLQRSGYNANDAEALLRKLLGDPKYSRAGAEMRTKLEQESGSEAAATAIESFAMSRGQ
jgi:rhamnosyltransferase subunit B